MSFQDDQVLEIVEPMPSESLQNLGLPPNDVVELEPSLEPIQTEPQVITEPESHIETIIEETKQNEQEPNEQGSEASLKKKQQKVSRISAKSKSARKINLYKCKVCKTQGKKNEVRMCTKCKFYFHKDCMDPNKILEQSKAFVCELCQRPIETARNTDKNQSKSLQRQSTSKDHQKKPVQLQTQKQKQKSGGFLNISKLLNIYRANFKKQEWKRKLYEFYKRYPYCFQKNRVVFPIEDHLLHIYQSIFPSYCKTTTPRPIPAFDSLPIPKAYYNNLFEIEVFFSNFWEDFKTYNFFKPAGAKDQKQYKLDDFTRLKLYRKLLPQGMTEIYAWILEFLLRIYLNDIMDRNRIDNMKYISSNPFFNLLATINENQGLKKEFIIKLAPEIIKNITKIPSFKRSFQCEFDGSQLHQLNYPKKLTLDSKIEVVTKLIRGLCDTDCFKEIVVKKSEMISQLTKEKGQTLSAQKAIQNENLPLRQKIKQLEKQLKQLAFSDPKEYAKKYEQNQKKLQKLAATHKMNAQKIEEHKQKIKQIARKMPFVNSVVRFLGVDRFKSEYFFYKNEKGKIYVKYRESLLSDEIDDTFMVYDTKDQIQQLKSWLNAKGTNERSLLFNITNLEQKDLLNFEELSKESNGIIEEQSASSGDSSLLKQLQSIKRESILEMLMFCENMYKQTLQNQEIIQQRELEFSDIYFKLFYGNDEGKNQLSVKEKASNPQQIKEQHPLKVLFSKYPSKLWAWNQKVKKFWFQFLDYCANDPLHETQGNLTILGTVWKITIKLYHIQSLRKKEKHQKKRLKQKQLREKQLEQMVQQDIQPSLTPEQNQSPQSEFLGTGRRLRKRQGIIDFRENQEQSHNESMQTSSKKEYSNQQESSKISSLGHTKSQKASSKGQKPQKKSKNKQTKKANKKLNMESNQSVSNSESDPQYEQEYLEQPQKLTKKLKSNSSIQQDQKVARPQNFKNSHHEETFCEQCFENLNYEKGNKSKLIKCLTCHKVYHKKCLDEDDALRLKLNPNDWKCDDCDRKIQINKHSGNLKITNDLSFEDTKRKNTRQKDKEQVKIIPQTFNLRDLQAKLSTQGNKPTKSIKQTDKTMKQKVKETVQNTKSKTDQKAEKKERKKIEEQSKIQSAKEENSESYEQERKIESKQSKNSKGKQKKLKMQEKQASEPIINKKGKSKKSQTKAKKQSTKVNTSVFSAQRRMTREKGNKKKIVEQSQEYEQPNSEEEESASI